MAARQAQRRRTRKSIVDAAARLIATGQTPSMSDVALAADVSRRTVYLYFPTLEQLLLDATLGMLSQSVVDTALDAGPPPSHDADVEATVDRMVAAFGDSMAETLPLGRALIKLTVDAAPSADPDAPRRGYRRIEWIERAIAPLRQRLGEAGFERLVSALAVVIGWEAYIVLGDIRGLDSAEQVAVSRWAARALVRAAIDAAAPFETDRNSP